MALIVRYKDKKTGKVKRVRTLLRPSGYFLDRATAEKYEKKMKAQGYAGVAIGGVSIPVEPPKIAVTQYSESYGRNQKKVILLHDTESHDHEGLTDVTGIGSYLDNKGYGVHYVTDGEGNVGKFARHGDLVYHAAGANRFSIGIEQIGFASWDAKQWLFGPSRKGKLRKQLQTTAHLIAYIADVEGIPLVLSTVHGIAMHKNFPEGGHTDPGKGYPIGYVLKQARKVRAQYRGVK